MKEISIFAPKPCILRNLRSKRERYGFSLLNLTVLQCAYNTRLSQSDGIILHVPQYQPSIYKSTKQFGLSFAYDAPKIWNELPDDV